MSAVSVSEPDVRPILAEAVEVARRALLELQPEGVGEHLGVTAEDEYAATHHFATTLSGYRGWQWAVVVAAPPEADRATVSESALLPGPDALVAPDFIPWDQRVRPGDLAPGDLLAPLSDDPRLVPGYLVTGDPAVDDVCEELGQGRPQVLSREGRVEAADRWFTEYGPDTEMARAAPSTCRLCGFYVPLAGALRAAYGVCANALGADGHVVHAEYGCGAHSDTELPTGGGSPLYEAYDDAAVELVSPEDLRKPSATTPGDAVERDTSTAVTRDGDRTSADESAPRETTAPASGVVSESASASAAGAPEAAASSADADARETAAPTVEAVARETAVPSVDVDVPETLSPSADTVVPAAAAPKVVEPQADPVSTDAVAPENFAAPADTVVTESATASTDAVAQEGIASSDAAAPDDAAAAPADAIVAEGAVAPTDAVTGEGIASPDAVAQGDVAPSADSAARPGADTRPHAAAPDNAEAAVDEVAPEAVSGASDPLEQSAGAARETAAATDTTASAAPTGESARASMPIVSADRPADIGQPDVESPATAITEYSSAPTSAADELRTESADVVVSGAGESASVAGESVPAAESREVTTPGVESAVEAANVTAESSVEAADVNVSTAVGPTSGAVDTATEAAEDRAATVTGEDAPAATAETDTSPDSDAAEAVSGDGDGDGDADADAGAPGGVEYHDAWAVSAVRVRHDAGGASGAAEPS